MPGSQATPRTALYCIKHKNHGLWPPIARSGGNRFDDPREPLEYRVLYTGDRRAAFLEKLLPFRPSRWNKIRVRDFPQDWLENYKISEIRLEDNGEPQQWLDFTSPETYTDFDSLFAHEL